MKIHVYSVMRDEEDILPYFLRHYSLFADKIFIADDGSVDKTYEIAKSTPLVEFSKLERTPGAPPVGWDEVAINNFFRKYKEKSRGIADWVICVDADEFFWNKNDIKKTLKKEQELGTKVIRPRGFNMVSDNFPTTSGQIYEECRMGFESRYYLRKLVMFDPGIDIEFSVGRHKNRVPRGLRIDSGGFLLLHYKYLSKERQIRKLNQWISEKSLDPTWDHRTRIAKDIHFFSDEFKKNLKQII